MLMENLLSIWICELLTVNEFSYAIGRILFDIYFYLLTNYWNGNIYYIIATFKLH